VRQHLESGVARAEVHANLTPTGTHDFYAMLADVAAQQRDLDALRVYAPRAEELAARHGHTLYQAIAHRAWGVAHRLGGELAEARARLDLALTLFQSLDTRWQIGRTLYELGELALAQREPSQARAHFSGALEAFEAMKAVPEAARAHAALAAVG
jgi:tetratricopeptide (TPR) repeat protein